MPMTKSIKLTFSPFRVEFKKKNSPMSNESCFCENLSPLRLILEVINWITITMYTIRKFSKSTDGWILTPFLVASHSIQTSKILPIRKGWVTFYK